MFLVPLPALALPQAAMAFVACGAMTVDRLGVRKHQRTSRQGNSRQHHRSAAAAARAEPAGSLCHATTGSGQQLAGCRQPLAHRATAGSCWMTCPRASSLLQVAMFSYIRSRVRRNVARGWGAEWRSRRRSISRASNISGSSSKRGRSSTGNSCLSTCMSAPVWRWLLQQSHGASVQEASPRHRRFSVQTPV